MSRVLKQGQTVTGHARVRVYQTDAGAPGQPRTGENADGTGNPEGHGAGASGPGAAGTGGQDAAGKRYALISEEKRKILEHAREQAEQSAARILEEAYAQRDNIVNTARDEAGRIHDQAKKEGYSQGMDQALEDISRDVAGIQAAVDRMGQGLEEFKSRMNEKVAGLAFMMAEKILRKKVEYDEAELADMVAGAVLSERDKENITVHIPEDAVGLVEALEKRLEPLRDKMGGMLRIKTESRPPGFVQVETEEGIVDASLDVQLDNLKKQLMALNSRE